MSMHRKPIATGAILGVTGMRSRQGSIINLEASMAQLGAFENGATIFAAEVHPMPPMDMDFRAAFDVVFAKEGPARGSAVVPTLERLHNHIRDVVFPVLEPLLS
jgi:hypothetical protein